MNDARNDGVLTNVYDGTGRVTQQQDEMGRKTLFSYLAGTTTITDPKGNVTEEHFSNLEPVVITRGYGTSSAATWKYAYDPSTLALAQTTDPNNDTTTYTDDGDGNITSVTDPLQDKTTSTYNGFDEPLVVTDANNNTTTYTYDADGNLTSVSRTLVSTGQKQTTTYTYGDAGHPGDVTAITDPNNHTSTYTYTAANGNLTSSTDPLGDKTTYGYDCTGGAPAGCYRNIGLLYTRVSPRGNVAGANPAQYTTSYTYNAFGEPLSVTDPLVTPRNTATTRTETCLP